MNRQAQGAILAIAGVLLGAIQFVHATQRTATTIGFLVDALPFVMMAAAIAYAGVWLARDEGADEHSTIVGAWAAGGAIGFASIAALILFSLNVASDSFPVFEAAPYIAIDNITAGTLAGVLVGYYDAENRRSMAELERQRDRVEGFANRAADVNNYGRALNQCDTVEEVSGLCVEGVTTLVSVHRTAVVELRGEMASILENTIVGVDDQVVAELAASGSDAPQAAVRTHSDGLPAGLATDVESALTILVSETGGAKIVLVVLRGTDEPLDEETRALLEMLVSHAGTALENIYRPVGRRDDDVDDDAVDIEVEFESGGD